MVEQKWTNRHKLFTTGNYTADQESDSLGGGNITSK